MLNFTGDPRANEWVGLTAMHTMFVREHNRIAEFLYKATKSTSRLTDIQLEEEIFQKTRRIVAAEIQVSFASIMLKNFDFDPVN